MICLDTSVCRDYLGGRAYAEDLPDRLEATFGADAVFPALAPTVVLYELYTGALRSESPNETPDAVTTALSWTTPAGLSDAAAREAAEIRATLLDRGEPINAVDYLIAGIARDRGATVVSADGDFEKIDDLDVFNLRENNE